MSSGIWKNLTCKACGKTRLECTCAHEALLEHNARELLKREAKKNPLMQNLDIRELIDMRPYETEDEGIVWALRYYDSNDRRCTTFFRRA